MIRVWQTVFTGSPVKSVVAYGKSTERSCRRATVSCHAFGTLCVTFVLGVDTVASVVHVIAPLAYGACRHTILPDGERLGAHGDGVRDKTVGALTVVGVEEPRQCAISDDDGVIHSDIPCQAQVDGCVCCHRALAVVVGELVLMLHLVGGYLAEYPWRCRTHCRGEGGVLVYAVVDDEIAGISGEREIVCAGANDY